MAGQKLGFNSRIIEPIQKNNLRDYIDSRDTIQFNRKLLFPDPDIDTIKCVDAPPPSSLKRYVAPKIKVPEPSGEEMLKLASACDNSSDGLITLYKAKVQLMVSRMTVEGMPHIPSEVASQIVQAVTNEDSMAGAKPLTERIKEKAREAIVSRLKAHLLPLKYIYDPGPDSLSDYVADRRMGIGAENGRRRSLSDSFAVSMAGTGKDDGKSISVSKMTWWTADDAEQKKT